MLSTDRWVIDDDFQTGQTANASASRRLPAESLHLAPEAAQYHAGRPSPSSPGGLPSPAIPCLPNHSSGKETRQKVAGAGRGPGGVKRGAWSVKTPHPRFTLHAPRFTPHASRFTLHGSRFTRYDEQVENVLEGGCAAATLPQGTLFPGRRSSKENMSYGTAF